MKDVMAVYDADPAYAMRFAEVMNQKEKLPFEVIAFTSLEKLKAFAAKTPVEILLVGGSVSREEAETVGAGRVIVLTDGEMSGADPLCPSVYKYQSSDNIIREVMACYCERREAVPGLSVKKKAKLLGVYSPIGRCLKTSFAITMGKLLSRDCPTLYLNLEEFSGLSALTHMEYKKCFSDLLYFYCSGNYSSLRLSSVIHGMDGLDYIPPVRYPEDLEQAGAEQVAGLLQTIARESTYEMLVVDVGSLKRTALEVLKLCDIIYQPVKEDGVSQAKLEEFERYLEQSGNQELKERIQRLKLPYHSSFGRKENYLEQLLWGELGDYTRKLLKTMR